MVSPDFRQSATGVGFLMLDSGSRQTAVSADDWKMCSWSIDGKLMIGNSSKNRKNTEYKKIDIRAVYFGSAAVVFYIIYFSILDVFGCDASYGIGVLTEDGACDNYIFGYSIIWKIVSIIVPFIVVAFAIKEMSISIYRSLFYSIILFIVSFLIEAMMAFVFS